MASARWTVVLQLAKASPDSNVQSIGVSLRERHSAITRVQIHAAESFELHQAELGGWTATFLDIASAQLESFEIAIDYSGDIPIPVRVVVADQVYDLDRGHSQSELSRGGRLFFLLRTSPLPPPGSSDFTSWHVRLRNPGGAPLTFAAREEARGAFFAAERFFFELDRRTAPNKSEVPSQEKLSKALRFLLEQRIAHAYDSPGCFPPAADLPELSKLVELEKEELVTSVTQATDLIRSIAEQVFDKDLGGRQFAWAFEAFASGRLFLEHLELPLTEKCEQRLPDYSGLPNGTNFFQFSELGFLAHALGIQSDFWATRLPALVRATQIFVEHSVGWRTFSTRLDLFRHDDRFLVDTESRFSATRVRRLREKFAVLTEDPDAHTRVRGSEKVLGLLLKRTFQQPAWISSNGKRPAHDYFDSAPGELVFSKAR